MKTRIEDEPVGFAANIRMTLLAVLAIAVFAGWRPDIEDAMATIVAVVAAVEAWTTWWARGKVTPESTVAKQIDQAKDQAHVDGYRQAEDELVKLDPAKLDPAPARARRR